VVHIDFESASFPASTVAKGHAVLKATWNDILWAAVTVGRPNRFYVFRHGNASMHEAIFRWSMIRMSLEQAGPTAIRLRRTPAVKTLDPSEKGAINYFLGLTFCKLFAAQLLNTPWLLHLDVFRPMLNPILTGRSRPDLIGLNPASGQWHAFECKGRASSPDAPSKNRAKAQAQRLVSINGNNCTLHIGAITYFRSDVLQFYWRDPNPEPGAGIDVKLSEDTWGYYFSPIADLVSARDGWDILLKRRSDRPMSSAEPSLIIKELDLAIDIHPQVAKSLSIRDWNAAHETAVSLSSEMTQKGFQPDGIRIQAGKSWLQRFKELSTGQGLQSDIE
jgi:hypothetical protein